MSVDIDQRKARPLHARLLYAEHAFGLEVLKWQPRYLHLVGVISLRVASDAV
jgi:hypothetical protein